MVGENGCYSVAAGTAVATGGGTSQRMTGRGYTPRMRMVAVSTARIKVVARPARTGSSSAGLCQYMCLIALK